MQTSNDIAEALYNMADSCHYALADTTGLNPVLLCEAADNILRLRHENDLLRTALQEKSKEYEAMYKQYCWTQQ